MVDRVENRTVSLPALRGQVAALLKSDFPLVAEQLGRDTRPT
jgi:hypothetical protein